MIFINCNKNTTMKSRFIKLYSITQDDRCCEVFYRCSSRTKFAPMWIMKPCLVQFIFTSHVHFRDTMHYHAKSIQLSNDHELADAICLKEIFAYSNMMQSFCCCVKFSRFWSETKKSCRKVWNVGKWCFVSILLFNEYTTIYRWLSMIQYIVRWLNVIWLVNYVCVANISCSGYW